VSIISPYDNSCLQVAHFSQKGMNLPEEQAKVNQEFNRQAFSGLA